jgi:hypothetical protein
MAESLLITKSDITALWPQLDTNTSDAKVNSYILRAQQSDLKPILGDALYYDVSSDPGSANNVLLIGGTEYEYNGNTIFFGGIKPVLSAWVYSRMMLNVNMNVGRASVVDKTTEESTPHEKALIKQRSREADSEAIRLRNELIQYLEQTQDLFPLYGERENLNADKKTSFSIGRVPRHKQL